MASGGDDTGESESRGNSGKHTGRESYRELALQLDPELESHPEDATEAERNAALPWRCQIVRIEEGGELDRALQCYVKRWQKRTGQKNIKRAPIIRGLLRIALLHTGCIGKAVDAPQKRGRKAKVKQLELWDPFGPVRELADVLGVNPVTK
jgi:hypothetical protein